MAVSRTRCAARCGCWPSSASRPSRPSRGFLLARPGEQLAGTVLSVPAQPEEQLRAAPIRDRLAARIAAEQSQVALARHYGVGLPILQRVLHRMEQEGLVSRAAGAGPSCRLWSMAGRRRRAIRCG